jgi:uncharacterized membrane protein
MVKRVSPPVFVGRAGYRQRRVRDALRLLPLLGVVLVLVPLLWVRADHAGPGEAVSNATALVYLFGAWALLIVLAFALSRALRPEDEAGEEGEGP